MTLETCVMGTVSLDAEMNAAYPILVEDAARLFATLFHVG